MGRAQQVSALLGGVSARYADSVSGGAGLLGGRLQYSRGSGRGELEANLARFNGGEWAAQVGAQGVWAKAVSRRDAVGLAAGGFYNTLGSGVWSAAAAAGPLVARASGSATASVAVTVGRARSVEARAFTTGTASVGGRYERGEWRFESVALGTAADTMRLVDWTAGVGWRRAAISLDLSAGARAGDLASGAWWQARAEADLAPWAALEGAVGRYPRDVTGFTEGGFAMLGLRLGALRSPPVSALRSTGAFRTERLGPARVRVTLRFDRAKTVALAGEWNDWVPAPMQRDASGRWPAILALPPGVYLCAILVDGGTARLAEIRRGNMAAAAQLPLLERDLHRVGKAGAVGRFYDRPVDHQLDVVFRIH